MAIFDTIKEATFNVVKAHMGTVAAWTPSSGGAIISKTVLFNDPTENMEMGEMTFQGVDPEMEFFHDDFPGLYDLVSNRSTQELVTIKGNVFCIMQIVKRYDGDTYIAKLAPI